MIEGEPALHPDDVAEVVASVCFPERDDPEPGRVGLEVERFAIRTTPTATPGGRLMIGDGDPSLQSVLDAVADTGGVLGERRDVSGIPSYPVGGGGRLTFEPGGALEHATAVHDTARGALEEVEELTPTLVEAFDELGVVLASAGVDPFHDVSEIPLQLDCFRYPAMAEYFDRRGPEGRVIMRHSCSIQVNLDLGSGEARGERWLLANLLAPLVTATFANSPGARHVGGRARAWQQVDPTRTGFPEAMWKRGRDDLVAQMTSAAVGADVLLVRTGPEHAVPGTPGWTFGDWLDHPHADHGVPSIQDLEYHLTTIFHEVRPRGMLEFRSVDAVPQPWRSVPVTLLAGAIEDPTTRRRLLGLLERHRRELPAMWRRAAYTGVGDPPFCALTVEAWSYAMEGAARLPQGYLPDGALVVAEEFLEQYTLRGRCPADDLRQALAEGSAAALASVAEPVPERASSP